MNHYDVFTSSDVYTLWVSYLSELDMWMEISEYHPDGNYIALYSYQDNKLIARLDFDKCVKHVEYLYSTKTCDNQFKVNFKHYILSEIKKYKLS